MILVLNDKRFWDLQDYLDIFKSASNQISSYDKV